MTLRKMAACLLAAAFLGLFVAAFRGTGATLTDAGPTAPGAALWRGRTLDLLTQGAILLGGVLGILVLLGGEGRKGRPA